jgi:ABC-type dipeptide/oligopeptide/nickel transport system permease subunit
MALIIGLALGLVSGYLGGFIDQALIWLANFLFSLPYFVIALIIVAVLGPGLVNALIAITIGLLPSFIRLSRASVLGLKSSPFVLACRAMGMGTSRVLVVHILPNVISPLLVFAAIKVGESILAVAALSFLGLGAQPPTPEWGVMLNSARELILFAPRVVFFPSLALSITVLTVNLLADGLRDRLDPRYQY